ncbi:DNA protecting protein DprA [Aeromicrobium marinum DSM 15272]|uniref:DNA protecting protein DprA n=1 Tax=Aeromicrobium marinum DSM 15272 TaxID=585531 RepID=E2SD51_9ACTN|nr:DNA-processing protein DprA [Aeromicrobium marinum]EFQ83154.1 DNA protecting protein DprA [Aeromicrobium marinum DSM 15272]
MRRDALDRLVLSLAAEPGDRGQRARVADRGLATVAAAVRAARAVDEASVLAQADTLGLRWISPGHPEWPAQLDDLDQVDEPGLTGGAPWGLWVRGSGSLAELCRRSVAVVGARECTTYGAEVAAELGADLADRGWTVVSGAAFGIDACAHRGALALGRPTVAVLAGGADVDYPRAHAVLLGRIAETGLVVSEQPPRSTPQAHRFLARNRLIAALSQGTVVVEAARRSGSLNTLRWSDRLGRTSMAVPGPVVSQQSLGTHAAIREGQGVLVTDVDDIEHELGAVGWRVDA